MKYILQHNGLILLIISLLFLFQLSAIYPSIMEARNFVSAREMLSENHWIYTTLNNIPRYEKPPLPTWITAVFGAVFGSNTLWALRIPNAILCMFMMLYLHKIVLFFTRNRNISLYTILIASTSYLVIYVGKSNVWDVYTYGFMLIAIYHFIHAITYNKTKNWLFFSLLTAASILSKGPLAIVMMFIPFLVSYFIFIDRKILTKIDFKKVIPFAILVLVLGFSWYSYVYFTDTKTFELIAEKEALARVNRGVKPFHRYFSFFAQTGLWVIPAFLSLLFPIIKNKTNYKKEYIFFLFWTLGSVFILSLVPEKKERYLFPVMFPLAFTAAIFIQLIIKKHKTYAWLNFVGKLHFALITLVGLTLTFIPFFILEEVTILTLIYSTFTLGITLFLAYKNYKNEFEEAFLSQIILVVIIITLGIPALKPAIFNNSNYTELKTLVTPYKKLPLISIESYSPELWFSYQDIIPDYPKAYFENNSITHDSILVLQINSAKTNVNDFKNYTITPIGVVDENLENPESNNYSNRKKATVYLFVKK